MDKTGRREPDDLKAAVRRYWDGKASASTDSGRAPRSHEFFEAIDEARYALEFHIPALAEFDQAAGKAVLEIGGGIGAAGANRPASIYAGSRIVAGLNSVAFSTSPAFDLSKGNIQQFAYTTGGSAISPSFSNLTKGQKMTLIFVQNGTTACTVTWPTNIHGTMSSSSLATLNSVNV
jgi:hypothetical protein